MEAEQSYGHEELLAAIYMDLDIPPIRIGDIMSLGDNAQIDEGRDISLYYERGGDFPKERSEKYLMYKHAPGAEIGPIMAVRAWIEHQNEKWARECWP